MKKQIGKRIGCAALATQMLLAPAAQAADPLRELLASSTQNPVVSLSETRLNGGESGSGYPHLDLRMEETTPSPSIEATPIPSEPLPAETTPPPIVATPIPSEAPPAETTPPPTEATPVPSEVPPTETTPPLTEATPIPSEVPPAETTPPSIEETPVPSETPPGVTIPPNQMPMKAPALPRSGSEPDPDYNGNPAPVMKVLAAFGFGEDYAVAEEGVLPSHKYCMESKSWYFDRYEVYTLTDEDPRYDPNKDPWVNPDLDPGYGGHYDVIYELFTGVLYGQGFQISQDPYDGTWNWKQEDGWPIYWDPVDQKTRLDGEQLLKKEDFPRLPNRMFTGEWYIFDSANRKVSDGTDSVPGDDYGKVFCAPDGGDPLGSLDWDSGQYTSFWMDIYTYDTLQTLEYDETRDVERFDPDQPLESYLKYMDKAAYLPIIGRWVPSNDATATKLTLKTTDASEEAQTMYQVKTSDDLKTYAAMSANDLKTLGTTDEDKDLLTFDPAVTEYFLRVPYDVTELAFDLEAYEPGSKLALTVTYDGKETKSVDSDGLDYEEYLTVDAWGVVANSADDPARGEWSLKSGDKISLKPVTQDTKYNVVTLTLTAPDGTTKKDYKIYVQRLTKPHMIQDPGNTPMGMIDRDDHPYWENRFNKTEAKEQFKKNLRLDWDHYIWGSNNRGGVVNDLPNGGFYHQNAWKQETKDPEVNLDLDVTAIVVYQNMPFSIPGFQIYDALGDVTTWTTDTNKSGGSAPAVKLPGTVNWTLELETVDKLSPYMFTDGTPTQKLSLSGSGSQVEVDLTGYNVKPGVYTLYYTYEDNYDETTHSGTDATTETAWAGEDPDKIGYSKKVVVLPLRGDVDMDGAVTPADGVLLQKLLDNKFFENAKVLPFPDPAADPALTLYCFRVCDVSSQLGMGTVDSNDVTELLAGYKAAQPTNLSAIPNYYYIPLGSDQTRQETPVNGATDPSKASVSLEYLGKTKKDSDPDPADKVDYIPTALDIFWVGVKLENAVNLRELATPLTSLTLTLTYDSDYVIPYVESGKTWGDYILSQNSQWNGWTLHGGETAAAATPHASKAETGLKASEESKDTLRELRLTLTPNSSTGKGDPLTDGELLRIPLQLKAYPVTQPGKDPDTKVANLVELTLGMRDLGVTTDKASAVWNNDEAWLTGSGGQKLTSSVTTNLTDYLCYGGSDPIPMGEDKTPVYRVYLNTGEKKDPVYGQSFKSGSTGYAEDGTDKPIPNSPGTSIVWEKDPGGVTFTPQTNNPLTGTPQSAGTFNFKITGSSIPFQLVVDKAPLDLTVQDVTKYYGEDNDHTTEKTFTYDVTQIVTALDGTPTGNSAEVLGQLLKDKGYEAPTFILAESVDKDGKVTEADATTVPGDYTVLIQGGGSDNYQFRYKTKDGKTDETTGSADYTILPRPLMVKKVGKVENGKEQPLLELWAAGDGLQRLGQTALYSEKAFTLQAVTVDDNGKFPDGTKPLAPLTTATTIVGTDDVEVTYDVKVVKNSDDPDIGFTMKEDTEPRNATVSNLSLKENIKNNSKYILVNEVKTEYDPDKKENVDKQNPVDPTALAQIKRVAITEIRVNRDEAAKDYYYGGRLNLTGLWLRYDRSNGDLDTQVTDSISKFENVGMSVYWVDSDTAIPTALSHRAKDNEILEVKTHNGKFLCIVAGSAKPVYIGPFVIRKNSLNLTVEKIERYYGEEDPTFVVTYDVSQLTEWDKAALAKDQPLTGKISELAALAGCKVPDPVPRQKGDPTADEVMVGTDVGDYFLVIDGAISDNYQFTYTRISHDGTKTTANDKFGYAPLVVHKRPILVTKITAKAGTLFQNTTQSYLDPARAVYSDTTRDFDVALPGTDTPGTPGTSYYAYRDGTPYFVDYPLDRTGDSVQVGDSLSLAYRAQFKTDNNRPPYFKLEEDESFKTVDVDVSDLRLESNGSGGNYELIFRAGLVGEPTTSSKTTGEVWKRKILGVTVIGEPTKTVYTYGEILDLTGLKVRVRYEHDENGILPDEAVIPYSYTSSGLGQSNTFAQIGLTICWDDEAGTPASDRQPLFVGEHTGRHLTVLAPQYPDMETRGQDTTKTALRVDKKVLTLKVDDRTRNYGETLPDYTFTFDPSQLSTWDREALGDIPATGIATALGIAATSAALSAVNEPYKSYGTFEGPRFETDAKINSPARQIPYSLRLVGGSMANYRFEMEKGGITVEKRPIRVEGILRDPIYTIFDGTSLRDFETVCYQGKNALTDADGNSKDGMDLVLGPGANMTGNALVGDDSIAIRVNVKFTDVTIVGGDIEQSKPVTVTNIELTRGSENYVLENPSDTFPAQGRVQKRTIDNIRIYREPTKMNYIYGESMDLAGMYVQITYMKMGVETEGKVETVSPTSMGGIYINYWDPATDLPQVGELASMMTEVSARTEPVASGDHLVRALKDSGFAHDGKHLLVYARVHENVPFTVSPELSKLPVTVAPRELTYTLEAEDKTYDGNTQAQGTLTLTNVYMDDAGNGDTVWIENGADYNTEPLPQGYAFASGDYNDGLTFTFVDPNVSYEETGHDSYREMQTIPVEVTNITLGGRDKDNYAINSAVTRETQQIEGRDSVPYAYIIPKERPQPTGKIDLWVDEHTNTVTVTPAESHETFGDEADAHNEELHYEYALLYIKDDELITTPYQDSPYFGGEKVEVAEDSGTGAGQTQIAEDTDFGNRASLPRGTYVGALVRLAQTNNYDASMAVTSFGGKVDDEPEELKAAFLATVAAEGDKRPPEPTGEKERWAERLPGPVIRTYNYRIDLVAVQKERISDIEELHRLSLEEVWFTDVAKYKEAKDMDRVLDNLEPVRYYGYHWDSAQGVPAQFPLALDQEIWEEIPVDGGQEDRVQTLMNPDGTIRFYVPMEAKVSGGGGIVTPTTLRVEPEELELWEDDEPVQLTAIVTPKDSFDPRLRWESSDESVVTVSEDGLVTVVGPGEATITVTLVTYQIKCTVPVRVLEREKVVQALPFAESMFNTGYTGAFIPLFNGRFEPERAVTRQELTVILEHFLQILEGMEPLFSHRYTDIAEGADYAPAVQEMDRWGIVRGVGEDMFAPDRPATRAEIAVILSRMLLLPIEKDPSGPHAFLDTGAEDTWAWAHIDALAKAGVTKGTGDGYYNPERILTRAELATMLGRILVTKVDKKAPTLIVPIDVGEDHWAYENILRAVNGEPAVALMEQYTSQVPKGAEDKKK